MNHLNVIARYNEDLKWIENTKGCVLIYNKGLKDDIKYPCHNIENYGKETETFLRFIVENYNILNNFEAINLLQGAPFEHCPDLIDLINDPNFYHTFDDYQLLTNTELYTSFVNLEWFTNKSYKTFEKLFNLKKFEPISQYVDIKDELLIEKIIYLCNYLNLNCKGQIITASWGAQYSIKPHVILSKSINWWNDLHKLVYLSDSRYKFSYLPNLFEFIWPLIWMHKENYE